MSKIYAGQRLQYQLDTKIDVSTGAPTLQIEFQKPDLSLLLVSATLVAGSTKIIEYTLPGATVVAGEWKAQAVITEGTNPAWRGDTANFTVNAAFT